MANTLPTTSDLLRSGFGSSRAVTSRRGVWRSLVLMGFVLLFLPLQWFHRICLALDGFLFPSFRRIRLDKPLFIIGPPRSGTTYLHRLVAADPQFTTFYLWELLLAPAICQKKFWLGIDRIDGVLGHPGRKVLGWVERIALSSMQHIHPTSLMDAEEDYFGLLPIHACFLLIVPFPDCRAVWNLARFDVSQSPESKQRVMRFYRGLLQRHLYVRGTDKHLVSKNPSFCGMLLSLQDTFEDARFALPVRTPEETLPSLLSSMEGGAEAFHYPAADMAPELLKTMSFYYRHISDSLGDLGEKALLIPYQDLVSHPNDTLVNLYLTLGYELSESPAEEVQSRRRSSSHYRSRHQYTLEQFGLDRDQIRAEYQWLYQDPRFGLIEDDPPVGVEPPEAVESSLSGARS